MMQHSRPLHLHYCDLARPALCAGVCLLDAVSLGQCTADDADPDRDVELLPEPVYDIEDPPEPRMVRERFLAGKNLSRNLTPLREIGGEGLHDQD